MVLTQSQYDAAYFDDREESNGLKHSAGYTEYLKFQTDHVRKAKILDFLNKHKIPKDATILELGAAVGFAGLIAKEQGYKNWTCLDWSDYCKKHEVYPIIKQDALTWLKTLDDNSYDYIISFAFLECCNNDGLTNCKTEMDRVAVKQIHQCHERPNPLYYNTEVKSTIPGVERFG